MLHLVDAIATGEALIVLRVDDLAFELLRVLASWEEAPTYQMTEETFVTNTLADPLLGKGYGHSDESSDEIRVAIERAWKRLITKGLIVKDTLFAGAAVYKISKKGREMLSHPPEPRPRSTWDLPKEALHETIRQDVWAAYGRGDFETAVVNAMKAVEISVRNAGGYAATDLGADLMRKAFDPNENTADDRGRLTDLGQPKAEREAVAHLFAGAIGAYKNPGSHRRVTFDGPDEVSEILLLASHLLRIANRRAAVRAETP